MRGRIPAAAVVLLLASSCSPAAEQPQAEEGAQMIECALGEGSDFGPDCLVERAETDGKRLLIVRHPTGGFRRFEQTDDGRGMAEVDGADTSIRRIDGETLELTVADDRYRFPVRLRGVQSGDMDGRAE